MGDILIQSTTLLSFLPRREDGQPEGLTGLVQDGQWHQCNPSFL